MTRKQVTRGTHFWIAMALIAVGVVFMLDNFDLLEFDVWELWPAILIIIGISKFRGASQQEKNSAYMFIGMGVFFMLLTLEVLEWSTIGKFWPIILIVIGLFIIYQRVTWGKNSKGQAAANSEDRLEVLAIFGGHRKNITTENFTGGHVLTIFGGADLHFDQAKLAEGENILDLVTIFGGTEIRVPKDWSVSFEGVPLFGGFEDKRSEIPAQKGKQDRQLIVKGVVLFGGLVLKTA